MLAQVDRCSGNLEHYPCSVSICVHVHAHTLAVIVHTVKPPNKGHFGDGPVVPCREVVLFLEVFF